MKTPRTSPRSGLRDYPSYFCFQTIFLTTKHTKGRENDRDNRSFCFRVFRVFRGCSILFLIPLVATAPRRVLCSLALCCAAFLAFAASAAAQSVASTNTPPLRFGVSARTMADLNRTDVTAALKVWFETIAKERGIYADPNPRVFDSLAGFAEALRREEIDVITAPSDEFIVLEKTVPLAGLYSSAVGGRITEEYVLLVRQDSSFRSLADLRDSRLIVLTHPSAGLSPVWLDTELLRNKLPVSARFFRGITRTSKMNRAILPVFFNQADAVSSPGGVSRRRVNSIRKCSRRSAYWRSPRLSCPASVLTGPISPRRQRTSIAKPHYIWPTHRPESTF